MPKFITTKEIVSGMQLAAPIKNRFGQILLASETILEERHIKVFQTWGIEKIFIKDGSENAKEKEYDENTVTEAKKLLGNRLRWRPKNQHEEELYEAALKHVLNKNF